MMTPGKLRGDIFGGISAGIVALPLALAFGVSSGMGAISGLYGAIIVGFFAAVLGGTPTQISGPTGPMTVVIAATASQFSQSPSFVFTVIMFAGILQILFGAAGFGRYIKLVPQPVISGFMSGIGVTVIILQIPALLGHPEPDGSVLVKLAVVPSMLMTFDWHALTLSMITFMIVIMPNPIKTYVPPTLLAITIGTLVGVFWLNDAPVIGAIPSGLPHPVVPHLSLNQIPTLLRLALMLAFLGSIDSLLTSLVADSKTRTQHNPNKELIGQGAGNLVAGIFGGLAGAGATMRTLVNIKAGGRSRVSGVIHSIILILIVFSFSDLAEKIPLSVLAGILLKVGLDIIDWKNLKRIARSPRPGVVIMLTTLLITVFVDLLAAVAVGIVMASVLFVEKMAKAQTESLKFIYGSSPELDLDEEESKLLDQAEGRIMLFQIEGPLSFGSARDITRMMSNVPQKEVLVVNLSNVPFIDSSAAATLEETTETLLENNDHIVFFGANPRVTEVLEKTDIIKMIGQEKFKADRKSALQVARTLLKA